MKAILRTLPFPFGFRFRDENVLRCEFMPLPHISLSFQHPCKCSDHKAFSRSLFGAESNMGTNEAQQEKHKRASQARELAQKCNDALATPLPTGNPGGASAQGHNALALPFVPSSSA